MTDEPLDYAAIRERAEWGDPADGWDHATVLRLLAEVEELTDRVIAESANRVDAADLKRENDELRAAMAEVTGESAIAKLREWTAEGRHGYEPGAVQIAMPVVNACKIIDEIDAITGRHQLAVFEAATLRTDRDQALSHVAGANEQLDHLAQRVEELRGDKDILKSQLAEAKGAAIALTVSAHARGCNDSDLTEVLYTFSSYRFVGLPAWLSALGDTPEDGKRAS